MKKERFSVEQIVAVLKQAETGVPVHGSDSVVGIIEQTVIAERSRTSSWTPIRLDF